jgi:hypothetical protein
LAIIFTGAGTAIESLRRKTAHYAEENKPVLPDVDLTDLPIQPGIPDESELTLLLNQNGIVPHVSHDLIPD